MATRKGTQRFNCTACGATDTDTRCLGNSTIHTGGRWMMPADFNRYMESRRPVDREAAAATRAKIQDTRNALTPTTNHHRVNLYRVENPHTGAVEFPEYTGLAQSWAVYARNVQGHSYLVAYSNAATEVAAIEVVSRHGIFDTDYAAAPLHTTTAGDRDAYLARRAILEDGTAERAKWARTLTLAAVDYLRTPRDDTDSAIAKEHVSDMIGQALYFVAGPGLEHEAYTRAAVRIETAAKAAATWFLIVERTLDQGTQIEGTARAGSAVIEGKVNRYLQKRDALVMRLEAATVAAVSGRADL